MSKIANLACAMILIGMVAVPAAAAAPPGGGTGPQCYEWYWEVDVGPVEVVSTSSCAYHVQESNDGEGPL